MSIPCKIQSVRDNFNKGYTKDVVFRKHQLLALLKLYEENEDKIIRALISDMKKPKTEAVLCDLFVLKRDVENILANLNDWTKPERPAKELLNVLDSLLIHHDPYGVVLIIGSWNYPLQLCLLPLAGAIAAGNCCVIKPSEVASNTSKLISSLVETYLDNNCYVVVEGGVETTRDLLEEKFDYIFFTGSKHVGKIVHAAANKNLTPVTLELGGKCPVYIDSSTCLDIAAQRVIWGKCLNAGQTCIAPDYVLCSKDVENEFVDECRSALTNFYGPDPKVSPDFCRIVNAHHFRRVVNLLENSKIVIGGATDDTDNYIEPTVIINARGDDPIMQEEIFGPVLPIVNVSDHTEAIKFINSRDKPLALYVFTEDKTVVDDFLRETSAGGVTVNDVLMHFMMDELPFGGVGASGMGAYHGKHTFDLFTHRKSVLLRNLNCFDEQLVSIRYPPYSERKLWWLLLAFQKRALNFNCFNSFSRYLFVFGLGFFMSCILNMNKIRDKK